MPELPEVESLRLGLVRAIVGSKILEVKILNEKIISGKGTKRKANSKFTKEFIAGVVNKKITSIERRAKNLIFHLNKDDVLLAHLKMTGQFVFSPLFSKEGSGEIFGGHPIEESETKLPHKHTYIIFSLSNGTLYYNDVRQFGYVLYFDNKNILEAQDHFKNIALEPFSPLFTLKYFKENILKYNSPMKKIFLDQKIVNGLGNIYADEVCFASSVLPMRKCNTLNDVEIKSLYKNIKLILEKAINSGGSSVANYLLADGKRGNYAHFHKAYKQQGKACQFKIGNKKCSGTIEKITFLGRGTHFCPVHQK